MNSYEEIRPGQAVTLQTRAAAERTVDKELRKRQIIEVLNEMFIMTAKEIAVDMHMRGLIPTSDRNFTAPRLTEMVKDGTVEVCGTKKCQYTGRRVSAYKLTRHRFPDSFYKDLQVERKGVK